MFEKEFNAILNGDMVSMLKEAWEMMCFRQKFDFLQAVGRGDVARQMQDRIPKMREKIHEKGFVIKDGNWYWWEYETETDYEYSEDFSCQEDAVVSAYEFMENM